MSIVERYSAGEEGVLGLQPRTRRSADAATIAAIFATLQFVLPSQLIMNGLPLSLSMASIVALGMGALWLCSQLTTTLGAAKGRNPVRTALFVYACALLASFCSAAFGYLPHDERALGDHTMVTTFGLIFVALAVCDGVRSRARLYFLVRVMVTCATGVAVVGILQFLFSFDLTPHLRPPGMHFSSVDTAVLERGSLRRVAGTTAHPIEFGVFSAMVLPLAVHVASVSSAARRHSAYWWTCTALIGAGLMFSVSRSAILALVSCGIVMFLGWPGRRRVRMVLTAVAFLVVIKLVSPGLLGTLFGLFQNANKDNSVQWRTHDYATARELISQHLLLGRGLGTWYAPKHQVFDNQYLSSLVGIGVVGLAALVGVLVVAICAGLRVWFLCGRFAARLPFGPADRDLGLSLAAALVVPLPTYATFDFAAFATVSSLTFLLIGISGAWLRIVRGELAGGPQDVHAIV